MTQAAPAETAALKLSYRPVGPPDAAPDRALLRQLLWLTLPILLEHTLHVVVGLWLMYLTVATTLDITSGFHLPGA